MLKLICKLCDGNLILLNTDKVIKIVKCQQCGFSNQETSSKKEPEIFIRRPLKR